MQFGLFNTLSNNLDTKFVSCNRESSKASQKKQLTNVLYFHEFIMVHGR
jgi:hypothetical protein